eukprot:8216796-Pyramimonas_sp.AAC.1
MSIGRRTGSRWSTNCEMLRFSSGASREGSASAKRRNESLIGGPREGPVRVRVGSLPCAVTRGRFYSSCAPCGAPPVLTGSYTYKSSYVHARLWHFFGVNKHSGGTE